MKKALFTMLLALIGLSACNSEKKTAEQETQEEAKPKVLVLYYSQTGTTKTVAEEIQKQLGADIEELVCEVPYDGDFNATIQRCQDEMADNEVPVMKPLQANIGDYDLIFLGYPIWFGKYAQPIGGLLHSQSFDGCKIVTFCTFGSGGLQSSTKALQAALPETEVIEGYGIRTARIDAVSEEVNRFLIEGGYKEGEIEPLPAFMEHHPVTAEEKTLFKQACGDYQFPLGTPKTVAVRETATSTDYEYSVATNEGSSTIYVTVGKAEGAKPVFTQVIRDESPNQGFKD